MSVNSRDFSGQIKKSWPAELVRDDGELIELYGVFDFSFEHPHLGGIPIGMISYEYYWRTRWYNVFRFHSPDGRFRGYYCNVNMPPVLVESTLDYVDLDIDVIVSVDGTVAVVDEDEFEENAVRFKYPRFIRSRAQAAVDELVLLARSRVFPFESSNSLQQTF